MSGVGARNKIESGEYKTKIKSRNSARIIIWMKNTDERQTRACTYTERCSVYLLFRWHFIILLLLTRGLPLLFELYSFSILMAMFIGHLELFTLFDLPKLCRRHVAWLIYWLPCSSILILWFTAVHSIKRDSAFCHRFCRTLPSCFVVRLWSSFWRRSSVPSEIRVISGRDPREWREILARLARR